MSQVIEQEYDHILAEIENKMSKIDPGLVMQTMYYERKFTDVEPQVELRVHYREGINLDQKRTGIETKYGFMVAKEPHLTLRMIGLMTLSTIQQISNDSDIVDIDGMALCSSY